MRVSGSDAAARFGVLVGDQVRLLQGTFATTHELLEAGGLEEAQALSQQNGGCETLALSDVELLSPITEDSTLWATGANYKRHIKDMGPGLVDGMRDTFTQALFLKASSSLTGPHGPVLRPPHVSLLDYEAEMAVVFKKGTAQAHKVTEANLHEFVAGVVATNDISARDIQLQFGNMNIAKGKSYRTFCPCGPVLRLLTREELPYLAKLNLTLKVNGEVRQSDSTSDLYWSVAEMVTDITHICNFKAGDILLTGTPGGTVAKNPPSEILSKLVRYLTDDITLVKLMHGQKDKYLQPGDRIEFSLVSDDKVVDCGTQVCEIVQDDTSRWPAASEMSRPLPHWGGLPRRAALLFGGYVGAFALGAVAARRSRL